MGTYKPGAGLVGAKGFEEYVPVIRPQASALALGAPNYAKVASWPDTGYEASYLSSSRPGGWTSKQPSMREMVYQDFATTRRGMALYEPVDIPLFGADKSKMPTRVFSTDLSIIDPLGSIENVTGDFLGLQAPLVGSGGQFADPFNWLGGRNIGMENYPSRFLDYGFSTIPMIAAYLMGVQMAPGAPKNADGSGFFPFENRPEYWQSLEKWKNTGRPPTDEELYAEAQQEAAKVSMSPSLMVPALFERYKWGRDVMVNGMSSGNNRIDYMAKKALEAVIDIIEAGATGTISLGPAHLANTIPGVIAQFGGATSLTARSLFTLTPGVGTPLAEMLMPVDDKAERVWGQLTSDQRREFLAGAGMLTMATDVVISLPLLSGAGALASALRAGAKGGEFMAWAYKSGMVKVAGPGLLPYESITTGWTTSRAVLNVARQGLFNVAGGQPAAARAVIGGMGGTLTVMDRLMAAGMASMLGNWALESMVPGYAEAVGYAIDNTRPASTSVAAGLINTIGYFSSATGGAWTMVRTTKAIPGTIGKGIGKTGVLGTQEVRGFAGHFGGMAKVRDAQAFTTMADGSAMTEAALTTPVKADVFSMLGKQVDDFELARAQKEFLDNPALAHLDPEARVDMFNEAVATALLNRDGRAVDLANILNAARSPTSFMQSLKLTDEMRRTQNAVAKVAREIEDRMGAALSRLYSENRWNFRFRATGVTVDPKNATVAYRGWLRQQATRMGWQFDEAAAVKAYGNDVNEWRQYANLMHANEFYAKNAQVMAAAEISPTEFLAAHPEDYFLMRSDHLFQDRADLLRSAISQNGTDAALMPEDELRALVGREIRTTQELDEWWSRLHGKDPDPAQVDLDELLDFMEQTYSILPGRHPHVTLDPLTADFPINTLARQLHSEGLFSIAYKPKGSIVAYRPQARTMAVRVSRNPPAGHTMDPPAAVAGYESDGLFHATTNRDLVVAEGLRSRTEIAARNREAPNGPVGVGLGGGVSDIGRNVSLATSEAQAQVIVERIALAARASRGEVTPTQILDEFRMYDTWEELADILGAPLVARRSESRFNSWVKRSFSTPEGRYDLVKKLDDSIQYRFEADSGEFAVGLTADFATMARIDPAKVGYVRVARREGVEPARIGPDVREIQYASSDLWVVDDAAIARHAGWTDDAPQPLENQWEQPWAGMIEDPTAGATPIYRHVSYIKLRDGTVVQAPFRDYPMNPGDINLGNRTVMGRKYNSIFQGVRSWQMAEHHLSQMARVFGNRYGFSAQQIEQFKNRVDHYARSNAYSPIQGYLEVKITPYANARIRSDEVNKIGKQVFGEGEVLNRVTGKMETLNYARLFADTHMQAWTLNLSSAITSRIKQFDLLAIGPLSTWIADWVVPLLRFKASVVFRTSELFESKVFAAQRGVNANAAERQAYVDAGLSPNTNLLSSDFGTDPLLESMLSPGQTGGLPEGMVGVNGLDDMLAGEGVTGFGSSYAIWRDVDDLLTKKGMAGLKEDIADPARYKNGVMFDQQIETIKRELPLIIKNRDPEAYRILSEVLKVPDAEMARFIVDDRILYGRWQRGAATLEDLIRHSNTFAKQADMLDDATMKAIYATEDWKALDTLMRVAAQAAQAEAFGTHYFGSYRSALERSINHPLLGIYPASWAYKSAKEWASFLYDNRTFGQGQLRLGMFPAVAVNSLIKQVNMTVAMQTGEDWEDWLQNGPARNWLFLWNLLLPGDWSSLPLPVARPLRSISRAIVNGEWEKLAPWNLAADTLMGPQGRGGIGIIRDVNLAARGLYDLYEYAAMDEPGQVDNLANGLSLDGVQQAPLNWSDLVTYPDPEFAPVNTSP